MSSFQPLSITAPRSNGIINSTSTTTTTTNSNSNNPSSNPGSRTNSILGGVGNGNEEDIKVDVTSPHELTQFVDNLLDNLEARFDVMNKDVLVSSLSTRIDSLETSIGELMSGSNGDGDSTSTS